MSSTALRVRKQQTRLKERIGEKALPMSGMMAGAIAAGFISAKMPLVSGLAGLAMLGYGAVQENTMIAVMGAAMLGGTTSDVTNFFEGLISHGKVSSEMGVKDKLKLYLASTKTGSLLKKKENPEAESSGPIETLSGISQEMAALDRIESQMEAQAIDFREQPIVLSELA